MPLYSLDESNGVRVHQSCHRLETPPSLAHFLEISEIEVRLFVWSYHKLAKVVYNKIGVLGKITWFTPGQARPSSCPFCCAVLRSRICLSVPCRRCPGMGKP